MSHTSELSVATIVQLGTPVLEIPAQPITEFDSHLRGVVDTMFMTMRAATGIGLAAPQIGISIRLAVIGAIAGRDPFVLVNPEVTAFEGEDTDTEGCLSIPGFRESVSRHHTVTVRAFSKRGHEFTVEAEGLLARVLQHEIDHLNGVLYIKHLNKTREKVIRRKFRRWLEASR